MSALYLIPARAGSKRLPQKNYKILGGKPLIQYSLEVARELAEDKDICVSTDDSNIIQCMKNVGYTVPFLRPAELATDTAGSYEVMMHAIKHYEAIGRNYDKLVLLQPTSPFRTSLHVKEALKLYSPEHDMVVSVREPKKNLFKVLMFEDEEGWLIRKKKIEFDPLRTNKMFELNGAVYVINIASLKKCTLLEFKKVKKYLMDEVSSLDIDSTLDWLLAEALVQKGINKNR
jgi:CMP-N,N'-diacetyllegionaminic acid synthase